MQTKGIGDIKACPDSDIQAYKHHLALSYPQWETSRRKELAISMNRERKTDSRVDTKEYKRSASDVP